MSKNKDLIPREIFGVKMQINTGSYSNRENFEHQKSLNHLSGELRRKWVRTNTCSRKPIFTQRSERSLKKICVENRFATTKQIKLKNELQSPQTSLEAQINSYYGCKASDMGKGRDLDFWKSVNPISLIVGWCTTVVQ